MNSPRVKVGFETRHKSENENFDENNVDRIINEKEKLHKKNGLSSRISEVL